MRAPGVSLLPLRRARLKAMRKGVKEAERRVRDAAARLGEGEQPRAQVGAGGGSSGGGGGGDGDDCSTNRGDTYSSVRGAGSRSSDRSGRKRTSAMAAAAAAAGGVRDWEGKAAAGGGTGDTPGNNKEVLF